MQRRWLGLIFVLSGCAGLDRGCSSCTAQQFGADWIIVQYSANGDPMNCWQERNVGVTNESQSDGVYWVSKGGHLIHIAGWYNRVQVDRGDFAGAARSIGVDLARCVGGRYAPQVGSAEPATGEPPKGTLEEKLKR